jgi:hypothetical protein
MHRNSVAAISVVLKLSKQDSKQMTRVEQVSCGDAESFIRNVSSIAETL